MRDHIADTAALLLLDYGADRVSSSMIAAYASVSETTVDYYFPDKTALARHLSEHVRGCCASVVDALSAQPSAFAVPAGIARSSAAARMELRDVLRVGQVFFDVMKTDRLSAFARQSLRKDTTVAYDVPWIVANLPHFQSSASSGRGLATGLRRMRKTIIADMDMRLASRRPQSCPYDGLDTVMRDYLVALGASADMADGYVTPALLNLHQLTGHTQRVLSMLP